VKDADNPVVVADPTSTWANGSAESPHVLKIGDVYLLWFVAADSAGTWRIGLAQSLDGVEWGRHPSPVLSPGLRDSWDDLFVTDPWVIFDGLKYWMWYRGGSTKGTFAIGLATSDDGATWSKFSGNPVLQAGSGGSGAMLVMTAGPPAPSAGNVFSPAVLRTDSGFAMWYNEGNDGIHHATSADGATCVKTKSDSVFGPGEGDYGTPTDCFVLQDGNVLRMWYASLDSEGIRRIGTAESSDGITWTRSGENPVLAPGDPGSWDDGGVGEPSVIKDGDGFRMWFTGERSTGGSWAIGHARYQ